MDERSRIEHPAWPLRAILLAALGAVFGLAFDALIQGPQSATWTDSGLRVAGAAFFAVSGLVFAVSLERRRWVWSAAFAAACGLLAAFVAGWNGSPNGWGAGEGWQLFSALLAVAIAVPLFQSYRDGEGGRPETALVHVHVWTNLVLGAAACAFVGATILLTALLAQLFHLIGIDVLRDLMNESAFMWTLAGGAFGGAVGLLRDRDQVLATLHKVGRAILAVLAPVLALGLVLFVVALPFTGLQPLWDQTQATTPILLVCILGAILLVNAAIGNSGDEEARSPLVRYAALALVPVMLPLAGVAAVSTAKRIGQYGLTPDRLWACVFVLAAASFALLYLFAVIRGRAGWPEALRRANIRLAAGLCLLALFLALPIVSFGAISTRDQLARLESGRVSPGKFDWAAMRFDFGPAGRRALERLRANGRTAQVRDLASRYLGLSGRYDLIDAEVAAQRPPPPPLRLRGSAGPVPEALRRQLYQETDAFGSGICVGRGECLLFWKPGERTAVALMDGCAASVVGRDQQATRDVECTVEVAAFEQGSQGWRPATQATVRRRPLEPQKPLGSPEDLAGLRAERDAIERGDVTVREVRYRQVYVGGRAVGQPFE